MLGIIQSAPALAASISGVFILLVQLFCGCLRAVLGAVVTQAARGFGGIFAQPHAGQAVLTHRRQC